MTPSKKNTEPQYLIQFLEQYTVPQLRHLAGLITSPLPNRKADIVAVIHDYLDNPNNLGREWQQLDEIQQAAVAEVVHAEGNELAEAAFRRNLRNLGYGVIL